jgi:hypothetical protein
MALLSVPTFLPRDQQKIIAVCKRHNIPIERGSVLSAPPLSIGMSLKRIQEGCGRAERAHSPLGFVSLLGFVNVTKSYALQSERVKRQMDDSP